MSEIGNSADDKLCFDYDFSKTHVSNTYTQGSPHRAIPTQESTFPRPFTLPPTPIPAAAHAPVNHDFPEFALPGDMPPPGHFLISPLSALRRILPSACNMNNMDYAPTLHHISNSSLCRNFHTPVNPKYLKSPPHAANVHFKIPTSNLSDFEKSNAARF